MKRRSIAKPLLLAGLSWWAATEGGAQSIAPSGSPVDSLPRPALPAPTPSDVKVEVQQPAPPAASVLVRALTPRKFDIEGVQSIPFAEVATLFAPLAGQPTTVAEIVARAEQATALYRQRGYALSFFFIPAQDFQNGVVRVVAVEGHVQQVRIEGNPGPAEARLREIAAHIEHEKPLRTLTFEHFTALLGRLPGLSIQAQVQPPTNTDGASTLVIQAQRKPYDIAMGLETRKPVPRAVVTGVLNDPFVPGGQLGAATLLSTADDDRYMALHYEQVLGSEGWSVKGSVSNYRGDPNEQAGVKSALQRQTDIDRAELAATLPLRLSRESSWIASMGLYGVNTRDQISNPANGAQLTDDARVRAVFAQLSYTAQSNEDTVQLNLKLSHGFNGLGAQANIISNVPGLSGPSPVKLAFARLNADGSYQHRFANRFGTTVSFAAQHSSNNLPGSEKISFGGNRFGSGYAPGEAAGDSGWGLGLELNRSFAVDSPWLRQLQPYVLLEAARVHARVGTSSPSQLRSVSLGVRLSNQRHYSLDLATSRPTGDPSPQNPERNWRTHLTLSYRLDRP